MIIAWWPVIALLVVLIVTILPSPSARFGTNSAQHKQPDDITECAMCSAGPRTSGSRRRHMNRAKQDNDWLIQLKAACEAGYYKAGSDEPLPVLPNDAACRDCFFWLNDFCRLSSIQRSPDADICSFFHAPATSVSNEQHGDGAAETAT
jgi:hypothetical protein